jgi:hypothetical protein
MSVKNKINSPTRTIIARPEQMLLFILFTISRATSELDNKYANTAIVNNFTQRTIFVFFLKRIKTILMIINKRVNTI